MSKHRTINLFFALYFLFTISCHEKTPDIIDSTKVTSLRPGMNEIIMEFDGLMRDITVQLPVSFSQETSYPVVFFFHGLGGNKSFGASVLGYLVDEKNFIGIYPQGYLNSWNTGGNEIPSTADDVGLTLYILNWLRTEISVDEDRIYSMGYSNGGAFSYTLALRTEKFAAIASMSASFFTGLTIPDSAHQLSVIQIHGELDTVVPYEGGQSMNLPITFQSALNTVMQWAVHDGLGDQPEIHVPEDRVTLYTFHKEGNPHEVRLYCLHETNHNISVHPFYSSNRCYLEIWEFFKQHPKISSP